MKNIAFSFGVFRVGKPLATFCAVCFICAFYMLMFSPANGLAAQSSGLVVTPLKDDLGPAPSGQTVPEQSMTATDQGVPSVTTGDPDTAPTPDGAVTPGLLGSTAYKDCMVMAYLVELMRKQDKFCPSGKKPSAPPPLTFSEPLCRVAESVGKGGDFIEAYAEQGIYASRWRMFSAENISAQRVATRLRAEHCEALHEPHTHIGAWRGSEGWRIILATLTQKPETEPVIVPADPAANAVPQAGNDPRSAPSPASRVSQGIPAPSLSQPAAKGASLSEVPTSRKGDISDGRRQE